MKCIIPGTNARVFAKAIQSMARIGTELFIEADDDGLSIRTVSSTKSAFAMLRFDPNFFNDYDIGSRTDDEFANKCKVSMKACIGVFKNMKQVELCKINIDSENSKLVVQLKCRLETIKTHSISILDFETLQAVYMTDNVPNMLTASHKLFAEISNNFQMNEEEITIEAGADNLTIKNYVEGSHVDRKFMRTQLSLKADEFDKFTIGEETSITFCLREFRALLSFAESVNMDMTVNFETAGRPVVFILNNLHTFEANVVMSTLSPDDVEYCNRTIQNQSVANDTRKRSSDTSELQSLSETIMTKKTRTDFTETSTADEELFNFPQPNEPHSVDLVRGDTQSNIATQMSIPVPVATSRRDSTLYNLPDRESEGLNVTFKDTEELDGDDNESVPKSPTAVRRMKKTRTVFKRCFESTFNPKNVTGASQVLAASSDTED